MQGIIVIVSFFMFAGVMIYATYTIRNIGRSLSSLPDEVLNPVLQEKIEDEAHFDDRIARMRQELLDHSYSGSTGVRHGSIAKELHPDVKNLPHDKVIQAEPDFEVAD